MEEGAGGAEFFAEEEEVEREGEAGTEVIESAREERGGRLISF